MLDNRGELLYLKETSIRNYGDFVMKRWDSTDANHEVDSEIVRTAS